jgi:hypothetical protein
LERAKATLSALRKRCAGDPASDHFAAKIQALRRRQSDGKLIYNPEILGEAMKVHDALEPVRKSANRAVLKNG